MSNTHVGKSTDVDAYRIRKRPGIRYTRDRSIFSVAQHRTMSCVYGAMKEQFLKKYWAEEHILFFVHFRDGKAIRQIEATSERKVFLTIENPVDGDSILYDQHLDDLGAGPKDFITEEEFERAWNKR